VNAANQLVNKIFNTVQKLEQLPESGITPEEIAQLNYREVVVNPCHIFYKIEQDSNLESKMYILHVLRQERELRKLILTEYLKSNKK